MGKRTRQWIAAITCNISGAAGGAAYVWMNPLLTLFISSKSPIKMSTEITSWLAACPDLAKAFVSIPAGFLVDKFGRKPMILSSSPLLLLSWLLIAETQSITFLFIARILQGAAMAILNATAPVYIAEIVEPNIRGKLSGLVVGLWYGGFIYTYATGPYLSYQGYAFAEALLPIIFVMLFTLIPESPYYHLMIKEDEKARESLAWFRATDEIDEEFYTIKNCVEQGMKNRRCFSLFATKKDIKAFLLVFFLCVIKYLNGTFAILTYTTQTFTQEVNISPDILTLIFGIVTFLSTIAGSFVTDKFGRKALLIISTAGSTIFTLIAAIIFFMDTNTEIDVTSLKWVTYASLIAFMVIANVGINPIMTTIQGEYFPAHTRGMAGGVIGSVAGICSFASVRQYQLIIDYFGVYMNYLVFAAVSFIGTVFILLFIPETTGKSLAQVQESALCLSVAGMSYSWVTPLMVLFKSPNSPVLMSASVSSLISATVELGAFIMCIPAGNLADRFGRKRILFSLGPLAMLAWLLAVTTRSVIYLIIIRLIHGFISGIVFTVVPVYIAEISQPSIRGRLGGLSQCGWQCGALIACITGSYLNYNLYSTTCVLVPILCMILLLFVPESPYYLLMKKKEQKSREALIWLQHSQNVDEEFQAIKHAVDKDMELKCNWKDLFATKKDIKAFCLVELVCIVKYFSGSITLQIYLNETINDNLDLIIGSNELSIIFIVIVTIAMVSASLLNDILGRRILLIFSTMVSAFLNLIIAIIFFLDEKTNDDVSKYKWITYISMISFIIIHNVGIGTLLQIVQAEYFPTHTRSIGGAVTQTIGALAVFFSILQYQVFQNDFGSYSNFLVFFLFSFIGSILIIILIPETSKKSLSEVQEVMHEKK